MINVMPAVREPDSERLLLDTSRVSSANSRLFILAASWAALYGDYIAKHRLARLIGDAVGKPRLLAGPAFGRRSVFVDRKNLRLVCRRRLCRRRGDVSFSFRTNEGRTPPPLASSRAA